MNLNYVIVSPSYSVDSGGSIFLHELANALDYFGVQVAYLPITRLPHAGFRESARAIWRRPSLLWREHLFKQAPGRNIPVISKSDVNQNSIIVYPEIVLGNPLGARNVVRWLLYKPGLRDPFEFGPREMFFRAGEMCDIPELTGGAPDLFLWKFNDVYRNENRADRTGACFLVRKGADKPRIPETRNAIPIDGLSHEKIADIFNRCETFYSYDEASMYSQYAALCGCKSIVIPGLYSTRCEWVAQHPLARYGIAYGLDDLEHAINTQERLRDHLKAKELAGLETVRNFIRITKKQFGHEV